ncbi:MAG: hypothetical protein EB084_01490 [Proteobacteria bacterium]|nr:hypothetical protein [Pseudomonadota bacterium]
MDNKVDGARSLSGRMVASRYLIGERLGDGSIWNMYIAQDVTTGQRVAVKVLSDEVAAQPEATVRFLKQAEDGFKLSHPNVVRSIATGGEDGHFFLVTELVQGRNLRQWFNDEQRDFSRLRDALKVICEALAHAHANGILHRSLRPENILVDENDCIRIADFGFARRLEGETRVAPGESSGVAYITPEQAKGQRGDARSDLYSLGVLLYELATGKVPFWAPDPVRIVFMHINEVPVRPRHINPKVPMWVEHIALRLLQKDPAQRYGSARDLADEITRLERHGEGEFIELDTSDSAIARRPVAFAPLVGRESEERAVRALLDRVAAGTRASLLVHGPAGTGKTRLLSDLASYANLIGFSALWAVGNARDHGPLAPFLPLMRQYLQRRELRVKDVVTDEGSTLEYLLEGRVDHVLGAEPSRGLARCEDMVFRFIVTAAAAQPLMLVLENIDQFDLASLRLIRRLVSDEGHHALLVALTWRDGSLTAGSAAHALADDLEREASTVTASLKPFDGALVRELMLSLVGADSVDDAVVSCIASVSEGLPLHVEEMLAVLLRERVLVTDEGILRFAAGASDDVVRERIESLRGLRSVFESRVATLPEKVAMLLTVAACIGPVFDFEVLMKVSGKPQDEVISILQWATRHHLIEEEWIPGRECFRFRHDGLQAALQNGLESRSRNRLHLLIGGATEEAFAPRLREVYEALAHHFLESEQYEKAFDYVLLAADRYHAMGESELSEALYARALEIAEPIESISLEQRLHAFKRLAHLRRARGDEAGGRACAERALALARLRNDAAELESLQSFLG